jgi:predicted Zn-dependent protease
MSIRSGILPGIILCLIALAGCSRKTIPAISSVRSGKTFDSSTYGYIYVEAIKEKLLGNTGDAMKYLEHCVKLNPRSDAAYYQMAQIVSANGDLSDGKKYLIKALDIEPKNIWYLMMMSSLCYQTSSIDSSLMYYEKAASYFPENDELQLTLGKMYSEAKNYDKAIKIFSRLDSKFGINENSTVLNVKNLIAAGRLKEAEEKTRMLLKEKPDEVLFNGLMAEIYQAEGEKVKAMEVYDILIRRNPDNPMIQLSLCNFLIDSKKYDDLFNLLNTISINQNIELEDKVNLFARMIDSDDIVKTEGTRLQLALLVLESNYSTNVIVPLLRADLLVKMKDLEEAKVFLEEMIKKTPENYYAWEKLLFVYLEQKDFKNLETSAAECSRSFNRSFVAKLLYANGAMENKNYTTALEELRKSDILAGNDKSMKTQVLTMKADLYYRMKDYQKAFMTYDEALKLNSDDLTLINNYAYYLAEQNTRLKDAEDMARKVVEKERSNTAYLDTYGWVLYKRGKLKAAEKVMLELINGKESADAEWYEHYGYILKAMKKCNLAVKSWQKALELDGSKTGLINEISNCGKKH